MRVVLHPEKNARTRTDDINFPINCYCCYQHINEE